MFSIYDGKFFLSNGKCYPDGKLFLRCGKSFSPMVSISSASSRDSRVSRSVCYITFST